MSEEKLIQEIYDLTLQNNTARELDDAFKQGIEETIAYLRELNLLRLHDVVEQSEQFKPFKESKGICKKCLRHWCICEK